MDEKNKKSINKQNVLIDKQIVLIDKQIKAVPRTLTNDEMQILLLQREQLVESKQLDNYKKESNAEPAKEKERPSLAKRALKGVARSALGDDQGQAAAAAEIIGDVGKKVFGKLFRKKKDDENPEDGKEPTSEGAPERAESSKKPTTDNEAIISILNKILGSFQADNERMRRSKRDEAESKLEGDPTPDAGSPEKAEEKKDSGMGKLLMFGAIAGLIGTAIAFKDDISKMLDPIKSMLGIKDPTVEDADKDDFNFDIGEMIGLAGLLSFLGLPTIKTTVPPRVPSTVPSRVPSTILPGGSQRAPNYVIDDKGTFRSRGTGRALGGAALNSAKAHASAGGAAAGGTNGSPVKKGLAKAKMLARGLGPVGLALGAFSLINTLDDIEQDFADGNITKEEYKNEYAKEVGGFLGGSAGAAALATVGAVLGAPVAGVGGIVGGMVGGITGFFAGDAVGRYLGEKIGAQMVGDPDPNRPPTPKPFTKEDQEKLKEALKDEKITAKLSPAHLQILKGLTEVDLEGGGSVARKAMKIGAEALGSISKKEGETAKTAAAGGIIAGELADLAKGNVKFDDGGAGAPTASGADPTATGGSMGGGGTPEAAAPAPVSATSGSAVTAATMNANEAQNTVTVLPPEISNETRNMRSGNEDTGKKQKIKMQVRLNDDVFRSAIASTAASRGSLPSVFT